MSKETFTEGIGRVHGRDSSSHTTLHRVPILHYTANTIMDPKTKNTQSKPLTLDRDAPAVFPAIESFAFLSAASAAFLDMHVPCLPA